ncbi:MAG TPA: hypothetical protein VEX35_05620 [Allosphingosinicella sp.]|nr:hypothetical protein [Allosphingosinicella sp.]
MPNALSLAIPATLTLAALPAGAALPPQHQRIAELRAVLDRAANAFGGVLINRIEHVRPDRYRVTAGRCYVEATIIGLPMPRGMVGARRFEVRVGALVCGR